MLHRYQLFIFDDSSDQFKTENGHHSINLTDDAFHLQNLFKHKTGSLLNIMLFPQKINTTARGPKWAGMRQMNMTQMDGWICLLLMFPLGAFYSIQMNPLCKMYIMEELSSRNWCIKQECGSLQRRSWSHWTSYVNEMSHKLAYQQM